MLPYLRTFKPKEDYKQLASWWNGHGWAAVPAHRLPPEAAIAYFEGAQDAAFGCLYMDNGGSGVCMLEWLVTNPVNTDRESFRAIKAVVEFLEGRARDLNYGVMLTTARQPSLCRLHERAGYTKTDEGMTHFIKSLL